MKDIQLSENFKRLIFYIQSVFRSKLFAVWFLIISLGLIFSKTISNFLANHILFGRVEISNKYFNVFFLIIVAAIILRFCWYFLINFRMSNFKILLITSLSIVYYFGIRDNDSLLVLEKFNENFLYADILLLTGSLTIVLFFRNFLGNILWYDAIDVKIKKKLYLKNNTSSQLYLEDIPVDGSEKNELDSFAKELGGMFINFKPQQAFIVGIRAKWGFGKTTFLKRLEYLIKYEQSQDISPIVFWFNTWQTQDDKGIVKNFFDLFKKELSFYNGNIESTINKYVGKLLSVVYAKEVRVIKAFSDDLIGESNTIKDYYGQIEKILEKLDRQIIVMVDDLDRLDKSEILGTLRVLRNAANFKNVIFICGVDKEYLIKNAQIENNYLDKIFNLEIDLPSINSTNLFMILKDLVLDSKALSQIGDNLIQDSKFSSIKNLNDVIIEEFSKVFYIDDNLDLADLADLDLLDLVISQNDERQEFEIIPLLPSLFFKSRRDIKRFYNYLLTNLKILKKVSDINLHDYILFHLMLFKYDWLKKYFEDGSFHIWMDGEFHYKFLSENLDKFEFIQNESVLDKKIIYTILSRLFPRVDNANEKGINQKRYFPIYLNNNIFNESFSYLELINAHEDFKLKELAENIDDNYLLNDIKVFLLKEENINKIEYYKQAIDILKGTYFKNISDSELSEFIDYGEKNYSNDFLDMCEKLIFTDIENNFGSFLTDLNFYYNTFPKDVNIHNPNNGSFENFFRERSKTNKELPSNFILLNKVIVRKCVIILMKKLLENSDSKLNIYRLASMGVEKYFQYFKFGYYYEEIQKQIQNFFKTYFKEIFLKQEPSLFVNSMDLQYFANIFVDETEKVNINKQTDEIIKRNRFSADDLNRKNFMLNGLHNFQEFLKNFETDNDFNEEELKKYEEFLIIFEQRIQRI